MNKIKFIISQIDMDYEKPNKYIFLNIKFKTNKQLHHK